MNYLNDREINNIVKIVIRENKKEQKEGLTNVWAGLKGAWKGYGYSYSKNMSKLADIVQDLRLSDNYQEKIKRKCEQIVDDITNSNVPEERSEQILNLSNRIIETINQYSNDINKLESEIKQVLE